MNDDTWYVVRNTPRCNRICWSGFQAGSSYGSRDGCSRVQGKPDWLSNLKKVTQLFVTAGAWKDTVGVIKSINEGKQTLTIDVEMFGRETPVENLTSRK